MIEHIEGDTYLITGKYYRSKKKFRLITNFISYALGINLWNGRVWQIRNRKRKLIKTVVN